MASLSLHFPMTATRINKEGMSLCALMWLQGTLKRFSWTWKKMDRVHKAY